MNQRIFSLRALSRHGWIQDQHGAWPMAIVPWLCGTYIVGVIPWHFLLLTVWLSAFHLFNVASLWAKARTNFRRRHRYVPALLFWSLISAIFIIILVFCIPSVLWWACLFAVPLGISVYTSWTLHERALVARGSAIVASSLLCPLAVWIPLGIETPLMTFHQWWLSLAFPVLSINGTIVWVLSALMCAYFLGTVPYVRSLIRGRGERRWVLLSTAWHLGVFLLLTFLWVWGWEVPLTTLVLWAVLIARSFLVPVMQLHGVLIRPIIIGLGEMIATLAVIVVTLNFPLS